MSQRVLDRIREREASKTGSINNNLLASALERVKDEASRRVQVENEFSLFKKDHKKMLQDSLKDNQKVMNEKAQMKDTLEFVNGESLILKRQNEILMEEVKIMKEQNRLLMKDMKKLTERTSSMEVYAKELKRLEEEEVKRGEVEKQIKSNEKKIVKLERQSAKQLRDMKKKQRIENLFRGKPSES